MPASSFPPSLGNSPGFCRVQKACRQNAKCQQLQSTQSLKEQEIPSKKLKALAFTEQVGICPREQIPGKRKLLKAGQGVRFLGYLAVSLLKVFCVLFCFEIWLQSHTLFLKWMGEV